MRCYFAPASLIFDDTINMVSPWSFFPLAGIMATGMLPGVPTPVTMDPGEASSVATMVLETLNVLCNPDICLDPTAPIERREIQEVPQTLQATVVASTLLELFPMLGANASLAHRVLRLMVTTLSGRYALRAAVAALHAKANGAPPPPPEPSLHAIVSAAEWVATRFWDSASRARAAGMGDDVANAYADVSEIMKEVCAAIDGDRDRPPPPPPAAIRFAEAAKAAVDAAVQVGLDPNKSEIRWESPDEGAAKAPQELFDPGTRMFWKNFAARAVPQLQAATTPAMKRYTRHTCAPDPELNVAATLHPPLAHPLRPMDEDMEAEGGESDGEAQPPPVELNPEGGTATEEAVLKATVKGEEAHDLGAGVEGSVQKPVEVAANGAGEAEEKNVAAVEPALPAAQPLPAAVVPAGATSVAPLAADLDLYADLDPTMALQAPAPAAVKTEAPPVPDAVQPAAAPPEQEEAPGASMPEEETQEPRELVAVKAEIPPAAEAVREEDVSEDAAAQEGAKAAEEPAAAASSVQHDTGNVKTEKDAPKDAEDYAAPAQDGPPAAAVGDEGPKSGAGEDGAAPKGEEVEGDLDPAALLANPEMVASLLKDPEKLKKLLAKNPALLAALKAKMS